MKKMKSAKIPAEGLMQDDHFKMAGTMYRIITVDTNDYGEYVLEFHPINKTKRRARVSKLITKRTTPFKIYNQK